MNNTVFIRGAIIEAWNWYQNEDFRHVYTLKDEDGTAWDLTGWVVELDVMASQGTTLVHRYSSSDVSPKITLTAASGRITVAIPRATIAGYTPGTYYYSVRERDADDLATYRRRGELNVIKVRPDSE